MKWIRRAFAAALFLALVFVAVQFRDRNQDPFVVDLIGWQTPPVATWTVVLVTFGIGFGAASLLAGWSVTRSKLVARRYRKAALRLESEIHQLRNLPLAAEESSAPREGRPAIAERGG